MQSIALLLVSFGLVVVLQKVIAFWKAMKTVNFHPGPRRAVSLTGTMGSAVLPPWPGLAAGLNHLYKAKMKLFNYYGWDAYAEVSWFGKPTVTYVLADAGALKEVTSNRQRFQKPTEIYSVLNVYGENVLMVEGEKWKKYKKLTIPAFTDRNNRLVWSETIRLVLELFEDVWGDKKTIEVNNFLDITLPITLFVFSGAGLGNHMSWKDEEIPKGHKLSFKHALHRASSDLIIKAAVPSWAMGLTARLRESRLAFEELGDYMNEMLQERLVSRNSERHDLFSLLMASSMEDAKDGERLDRSEILGNAFIFLIAGHETTANTLCFAFALLALYQDEQERLYEHVCSVLTDKRIPTYADMPLLTRCLAFTETEGIAVLALMVSKYKVSIKEEPQFASETFEQRKARVLNTKLDITLGPVRVPLVFTRRD
ncbi:614/534 cytochrome P450 [Coprinopsis cinerea okayama7|uniref:614/534 cytochrome P450 n=1 Tax=Coprinopsis cinerea (strain Okayama-7 / 130 / ATCC MYA-4618 / FGSC 9003) TaxID=240176 RepID=A8NQB2_COPC7|nr:614/534 cytochrome P450 [Coprinopsis cinerea okayama7\|eukprot:XP_001835518.2 614/534 cytochrome P450 [Coprinopsis cinerea okayama7\